MSTKHRSGFFFSKSDLCGSCPIEHNGSRQEPGIFLGTSNLCGSCNIEHKDPHKEKKQSSRGQKKSSNFKKLEPSFVLTRSNLCGFCHKEHKGDCKEKERSSCCGKRHNVRDPERCPVRCGKCHRIGHFTSNCRGLSLSEVKALTERFKCKCGVYTFCVFDHFEGFFPDSTEVYEIAFEERRRHRCKFTIADDLSNEYTSSKICPICLKNHFGDTVPTREDIENLDTETALSFDHPAQYCHTNCKLCWAKNGTVGNHSFMECTEVSEEFKRDHRWKEYQDDM
jgi:hypothetical protein